jgi:hypothetical protein
MFERKHEKLAPLSVFVSKDGELRNYGESPGISCFIYGRIGIPLDSRI